MTYTILNREASKGTVKVGGGKPRKVLQVNGTAKLLGTPGVMISTDSGVVWLSEEVVAAIKALKS